MLPCGLAGRSIRVLRPSEASLAMWGVVTVDTPRSLLKSGSRKAEGSTGSDRVAEIKGALLMLRRGLCIARSRAGRVSRLLFRQRLPARLQRFCSPPGQIRCSNIQIVEWKVCGGCYSSEASLHVKLGARLCSHHVFDPRPTPFYVSPHDRIVLCGSRFHASARREPVGVKDENRHHHPRDPSVGNNRSARLARVSRSCQVPKNRQFNATARRGFQSEVSARNGPRDVQHAHDLHPEIGRDAPLALDHQRR